MRCNALSHDRSETIICIMTDKGRQVGSMNGGFPAAVLLSLAARFFEVVGSTEGRA
jgi:hypothetical protein